MPPSSHLEFFEITDFTPGLQGEDQLPGTTAVDKRLLLPTNAAVVMNDCEPRPGGGLRAFFRPTTVSTSGITDVTKELVTGVGNHTGLALRSGAVGVALDRYLTTIDTVADRERIYRMDGTNGETTWKQGSNYNRSAGTVGTAGPASMFPFVDVSGNRWMVVVLRSANEPGFYKIAYVAGAGPPAGDGDITKINTWDGPAVANQARVIIGESTQSPTLQWTDEGTLTPSVDSLDIAPYQDGADLRGIQAMEPSDLLIVREGAPWVAIQGDVTSASVPVREMGGAHTGLGHTTELCRTPDGLAFIEPGGRIYLTDGRSFTPISPTIEPFYRHSDDVRSSGKMVFANRYLFAPGGYVRDWESGAWFKVSEMADSNPAQFWSVDAAHQRVWGASAGFSFRIREYAPWDQDTKRNDDWVWQSAPWARSDGRTTRIREVQLFVVAHATSTLTVERINADGTSTTRTAAAISSGKQMVSFLFPNTGSEYQSIKVTAAADSASNEAPTLERIRVGMARPGNRAY